MDSYAEMLGEPESLISLGHRVREQLMRFPRGERYVDIYNDVSAEAVRITLSNPRLIARTARFLERNRRLMERFARGGNIVIRRATIEEIDELLAEYQQHGRKSTETLITALRADIHNVKVLRELGVSVDE